MDKEYKKVEDYYKFVSQKANQTEHRGFLNSRKAWLKQHNEAGPTRKRLLSKEELQPARKELSVQTRTGGRFVAPKKQFVSQEEWDPNLHGELDPSKLVTEVIFGKSIVGCWLNKGPRGIYDFEEYQDTSLQEKEWVHDSRDAPFSEEALGRKRKAVLDEFTGQSQGRDKVAVQVEGKEMSMEGLLQMLRDTGAAPGEPSAAEPAKEACDKSEAESSDSDASSSEGQGPAFFQPVAKKSAAVSKATPKPAAASGGNKAQRPVRAVETQQAPQKHTPPPPKAEKQPKQRRLKLLRKQKRQELSWPMAEPRELCET